MHGELLADRIRRGNALALAVAAAGHAANDGVDFVAGALGVGQSFKQERARALAHDEAVGAIPKRPRAGSAQRADLAELDKGRRAHVAVDAPGEHGVHLVLVQHLDGRLDSGEAAGAGGVGDKVRAAQVEHVGHTPGDDVGQFAGHGVFGDGRHTLVECGVKLFDERFLGRRGEFGELGCAAQPTDIFGEDDALRGDVVQFAAHGRAQNDAGSLGIERPVGIAVVGQRIGGDGDGPLLAFVH